MVIVNGDSHYSAMLLKTIETHTWMGELCDTVKFPSVKLLKIKKIKVIDFWYITIME